MKSKGVPGDPEKCAISRGGALVCAVFFIGVLLSGAVYYGISVIMGHTELCDGYYDGEKYDFGAAYRLDDVFYRSAPLRRDIMKLKYLLFGRVENEDIIVGDDGYLFDVYDTEYGYDYVRDYIGEFYSDEELRALADAVKFRRDVFAAYGAEYRLAVIPNSQTVCSDKIPDYFGSISPDTRLARFSALMAEEGEDCMVDLSATFCPIPDAWQLYNNTENSVNSLGAYYIYRTVFESLPAKYTEGHWLIPFDSLRFITQLTDGRTLARRAGLEKVIRNRTVSLPSETTKKYITFGYFYDIEATYSKSEYRDEIPVKPTVLLEFLSGDEWDKILLSEYFSGTFGDVGYRFGHDLSTDAIGRFRPQVVIQFIHENELSALLDPVITETYENAYADVMSDAETKEEE